MKYNVEKIITKSGTPSCSEYDRPHLTGLVDWAWNTSLLTWIVERETETETNRQRQTDRQTDSKTSVTFSQDTASVVTLRYVSEYNIVKRRGCDLQVAALKPQSDDWHQRQSHWLTATRHEQKKRLQHWHYWQAGDSAADASEQLKSICCKMPPLSLNKHTDTRCFCRNKPAGGIPNMGRNLGPCTSQTESNEQELINK